MSVIGIVGSFKSVTTLIKVLFVWLVIYALLMFLLAFVVLVGLNGYAANLCANSNNFGRCRETLQITAWLALTIFTTLNVYFAWVARFFFFFFSWDFCKTDFHVRHKMPLSRS